MILEEEERERQMVYRLVLQLLGRDDVRDNMGVVGRCAIASAGIGASCNCCVPSRDEVSMIGGQQGGEERGRVHGRVGKFSI